MSLKQNFKPRKFKFNKVDAVLGAVLSFAIFWSDVLQNKILDKGYDVIVHLTPSLQYKAIILWYYTLVLMFVIMFVYMLKAVLTHEQGEGLDVSMGVLGIVAVVTMWLSTLFMASAGFNFSVPFLNWQTTLISIYHFGGVAIMIIVATYFSVTE